MPPSEGDPFESIVALLSTSIGEEASREIVGREAKKLNLVAIASRDEVMTLLQAIEKAGGTPGLAARLALSRLERGVAVAIQGVSSLPPASARPAKRSVALLDIAQMLSPSLGDVKADALISAAAKNLKLQGPSVSREEAVNLLESLVAQGGVVATVARFAKVRFLLEAPK